MSYRGGDLDLRTPQNRGGSERVTFDVQANGSRDYDDTMPGERGPIWVDDTLLACCNHAYDVALAHRSGDVRIEHLLYALTRIDDAAEVLEKHGVRDASLRREAGLYIASEIPIAPTNGQATPRRSQSFEKAIQLAAKYAYARSRPATVSDLLHVFSEIAPDLPGLQLLHRNMPGLIGDTHSKPQGYQQLPDSAFLNAVPEMPRRAMRPAYYDEYAMAEAASYRQNLMQSQTDMMQNSRLAALEKMVMSLRDETGRLGDDLAGRFVSLESTMSGSRDDGQALRQTSDKLTGLERGLSNKLEELAKQASLLSNRMETMEHRLQSAYSTGGIDLSPLERKLEGMEQRLGAVASSVSERTADLEPVLSRLERLENTLREERGASEAALKLTGDRISGGVEDRLRQIERFVSDKSSVSVDLVPLEGRLNDIETAVLSLTDARDPSEGLVGRLENLEQTLASRLQGMEQARMEDRDRVLAQGAATSNDVKATSQQIAHTLSNQAGSLQRLETTLQQRIDTISQAAQELAAGRAELTRRMEALETMMIRHGQEAAEGRETSLRELGEVHEAIVKLNANQHTLAGAIDQWRSESVNDMNTISTRLGALDQMDDAPMQRLELISERMDGLYRATVERYHRRNRFWYWLFGTDDWIGASWPSQTAKVEQELRTLGAADTVASHEAGLHPGHGVPTTNTA